jgi:hypothetical protein
MRGRAARAAQQEGASTPPFFGSRVQGFQQGVGSGLCRVPRELMLCCGNSSQLELGSTAQAEHKSGEVRTGLRPIEHCLVGGGSGGEVGGAASFRAGAG